MMPTNWMPLEAEVTEVSLTTSESAAQDLSAGIGRDKVVIGVSVAFKLSAAGTSTITSAKAVYPPGVYEFSVTKDRCFFKAKTLADTGALSWYLEKGH